MNIALPGFEPGSQPSEGRILDRYTTGLLYKLDRFSKFKRFYNKYFDAYRHNA